MLHVLVSFIDWVIWDLVRVFVIGWSLFHFLNQGIIWSDDDIVRPKRLIVEVPRIHVLLYKVSCPQGSNDHANDADKKLGSLGEAVLDVGAAILLGRRTIEDPERPVQGRLGAGGNLPHDHLVFWNEAETLDEFKI